MLPDLPASIIEFFEYTRSRVTGQDIIDFSPNDPGYGEYVELWTKILMTGTVPRKSEFDLSEVIALTGRGRIREDRPIELERNYRRFTRAVALVLIHYGNHAEEVRPANYLASELIIDMDKDDHAQRKIMRDVFAVTRCILIAQNEEEYPFFTLGMLLLAQRDDDWDTAHRLATLLIEDECAARDEDQYGDTWQRRFLFSITCYDRFQDDWDRLTTELKNPHQHEDTQLVIDALKLI